MSELIPYLSGLVCFLFGIALYLSLQELKRIDENDPRR